MLGLLFLQFRSLTEALIVLVSVPFALVGSFWTLYLLGYPTVGAGLGRPAVGRRAGDADRASSWWSTSTRRSSAALREGKIRSRDDIVAAHAEGHGAAAAARR